LRPEAWHDFYLLIGTAAATFMGLTFVAVTLAPKVIAARTFTAVRAFVTPIVAYFATVLVVSLVALLPLAPDSAPHKEAILLAVIGLVGAIYVPSTGVQKQWREMELGADDLLWYAAWPFVGYLLALAAAFTLWRSLESGAWIVAADVMLFLIVGIRNAWDVVIAIARESQA
jgi:hypothetical protein